MHRIDDPTASPTLPAPRPAGTPGYFTGGSPGSSGFAATVVRYEFMNAVQEELSAVVEASGVTLDKTNNGQLLAALRKMLRFKLTQDEYLYISPTGSDTNDGLTPATAFRTGQAAWDFALTVDLNNHSLILQFADGTYTDPINCFGTPLGIGGASGIVIQGNTVTPASVIFSTTNISCVSASAGANLMVRGVSLAATGVPGSYQNMGAGLQATTGGSIQFGSVIFQRCDFAHIAANGSGVVQSNGNPYQIAAGGGRHMVAGLGGYVANANSAVSLTGNPAFSACFADAESHGIIVTYGAAYSGAATGRRYLAGTGGMVHTNGAGVNFLPGDAAGTADAATFGLYL
jgi:hypothetical protein